MIMQKVHSTFLLHLSELAASIGAISPLIQQLVGLRPQRCNAGGVSTGFNHAKERVQGATWAEGKGLVVRW